MKDKPTDDLFRVIKLSSEYDKSSIIGKFIFLLSFFIYSKSLFRSLGMNQNQINKSNCKFSYHFRWQWRFFYRWFNKPIKLKDIPEGRCTDGADYVHNEFQK